MIENYAEEVEMLPDEPQDASFATIGEVYNDGISLIFPGSEAASEKHYKCNQYCKFAARQRVHVMKDSGTYVVMFPIGAPGQVISDMVHNTDTNYPGLQFRYSVQGRIDVKNSAGTNWTRLSGTIISG